MGIFKINIKKFFKETKIPFQDIFEKKLEKDENYFGMMAFKF